MKKRFLFAAVILAAFALLPNRTNAEGAEDLKGIKSSDVKMPIYHKQQLQFFVTAKQMVKQGVYVNATDTVIDIIRKGINVDNFNYMTEVKPYQLGAPLAKIIDFWKDKLHSEGFISSSKALINYTNQTASGNERVFLRSPVLDLNGIGFVANYGKRTVLIRKDVRMIIRMDAGKTRKLSSKMLKNEKSGLVHVSSNTLFIDFEKNLIILEGNVKVNEARFKVDCDKIVILLKKKSAAKDKDIQDMDSPEKMRGVSIVTFTGNVVMSRKISPEELKKNGEQKALADKVVYDVPREKAVLTGKKPTIMRGRDQISGRKITVWRNSERMLVDKDCRITMRVPKKGEDKANIQPTIITSDNMDLNYSGSQAVFTGNVKINDKQMKLDCLKMTIYLEDRPGNKKTSVTVGKTSDFAGMPNAMKSGAKDISRIICVGEVVVTRKINGKIKKDENARAEKAIYMLKESKIILSGNRPIIIRGKDSISGRTVAVWLNQERMTVDKNSRIVLASMRSGKLKNKTGGKPLLVTSDSTDLNYGSNVLSFVGNVKIKDPKLKLDCRDMKIYLEKVTADGRKKSADKTDDLLAQYEKQGNKKEVYKVVCTGDVRAEDPRARLNCEKLTITFRERKKKPADSDAGPFSGGNREIYKIFCDKNVRLENKPKKQSAATVKLNENDDLKTAVSKNKLGKAVATSDHAIINIPDNWAVMTGNVKIDEPRVNLSCGKMTLRAKNSVPGFKLKPEERYGVEDIEGDVPQTIGIGSGRELTEIICRKNVVITRKINEELQRAKGDKAVYDVDERKITLLGTKEKMPELIRDSNTMEGDEIILWTNSEKLDIKNGRLKLYNLEKLMK